MNFAPYAVDFLVVMTCILVLVALVGPLAKVMEASWTAVVDGQDRIWEKSVRRKFHRRFVLRQLGKERRDEVLQAVARREKFAKEVGICED